MNYAIAFVIYMVVGTSWALVELTVFDKANFSMVVKEGGTGVAVFATLLLILLWPLAVLSSLIERKR